MSAARDRELKSLVRKLGLGVQQEKTMRTAKLTRVEDGRLISLQLTNLGLTHLPADLFENRVFLENLYLSDNNIEVLADSLFSPLTNLKVLDLAHNNISSIPKTIFKDLERLEELLIGSNKLVDLPPLIFEGLNQLRVLSLSDNSLKTLPVGLLDPLQKAQKLFLQQNHIEMLPTGFFKGNPELKWVSLSNNHLSFVPDDLFEDTPEVEEIFLQNNNLTTLPSSIYPLKKLKRLRLEGNDDLPSYMQSDNLSPQQRLGQFQSHEDHLRETPELEELIHLYITNQLRLLRDQFRPDEERSPLLEAQKVLRESFPDLVQFLTEAKQMTLSEDDQMVLWGLIVKTAGPLLEDLQEMTKAYLDERKARERYHWTKERYTELLGQLKKQKEEWEGQRTTQSSIQTRLFGSTQTSAQKPEALQQLEEEESQVQELVVQSRAKWQQALKHYQELVGQPREDTKEEDTEGTTNQTEEFELMDDLSNVPDLTDMIDSLLGKYSDWETEGIGKKE